MGDFDGYWRYRVGDYRIICEFLNEELVIVLVSLAHRKDIYQ